MHLIFFFLAKYVTFDSLRDLQWKLYKGLAKRKPKVTGTWRIPRFSTGSVSRIMASFSEFILPLIPKDWIIDDSLQYIVPLPISAHILTYEKPSVREWGAVTDILGTILTTCTDESQSWVCSETIIHTLLVLNLWLTGVLWDYQPNPILSPNIACSYAKTGSDAAYPPSLERLWRCVRGAVLHRSSGSAKLSVIVLRNSTVLHAIVGRRQIRRLGRDEGKYFPLPFCKALHCQSPWTCTSPLAIFSNHGHSHYSWVPA